MRIIRDVCGGTAAHDTAGCAQRSSAFSGGGITAGFVVRIRRYTRAAVPRAPTRSDVIEEATLRQRTLLEHCLAHHSHAGKRVCCHIGYSWVVRDTVGCFSTGWRGPGRKAGVREVLRGAARRPCDPPEGVAAALRSVLVLTHSRLKNRHAGDEEEPEFQQAEFQRLLTEFGFSASKLL